MPNKQLYQIALTMIKGVGHFMARQLLMSVGDAEAIFSEKKQLLEKIPGIGSYTAAQILRPEVLVQAEKEQAFIEKNKLAAYFFTDEAYPARLKECEDAPLLLYFKGNTNLNAQKIISIVGTRHATDYGRKLTEELLCDLSQQFPELLIVSGLAYGIDILAHRGALKNHLPTVGVLAHGLDRLYPPLHRNTAVEMLDRGGLLTDFPSGTNPDRPNFVKRNRIVAGLADATIVVESAEKGGSLITADIAFSYGRDVYSFPGRINDEASKGCNALIRDNKAGLITSAADLVAALCWDAAEKKQAMPLQTSFLFALTEEEEQILAFLKETKEVQINQFAVKLNLPIQYLSPLLVELEMKGLIKNMPGGIYKLV